MIRLAGMLALAAVSMLVSPIAAAAPLGVGVAHPVDALTANAVRDYSSDRIDTISYVLTGRDVAGATNPRRLTRAAPPTFGRVTSVSMDNSLGYSRSTSPEVGAFRVGSVGFIG